MIPLTGTPLPRVWTEKSLTGCTISKDEDDQQYQEADELGKHPVHDDHLRTNIPPNVKYSQESEVEHHIVGGKHNPEYRAEMFVITPDLTSGN